MNERPEAPEAGWSIRACRPEDVDAVLALWRDAGASPSPTDTAAALRGAIEHPSAWVLVAEAQGQIAGSIIGAFDGWRGSIYRLAVHPLQRRRGCARALVAAVERLLVDHGARRITALVERDHPGAVGFWEAADYVPDRRMARYVRNL